MTIYNFNEHRHNYAVWTAARAVQRNFTTTATIRAAIEQTGLRAFAEDNGEYDQQSYDQYHRLWSSQLLASFDKNSIKTATYGRTAKIISIYLKTSVVLVNKGICKKSAVIHPPIDRILLQSIARNIIGFKDLSAHKWTIMNEEQYWLLVERLRKANFHFNWQLEAHWTP